MDTFIKVAIVLIAFQFALQANAENAALHTAVCRADRVTPYITVDQCLKIIKDNLAFFSAPKIVPLARALLKSNRDKCLALQKKFAGMPGKPSKLCADILQKAAENLDGKDLGNADKPDWVLQGRSSVEDCSKENANMDDKTKAEMKDLLDGIAVCHGAALYAVKRYGALNVDDYGAGDYDATKVVL